MMSKSSFIDEIKIMNFLENRNNNNLFYYIKGSIVYNKILFYRNKC